MVNMIAFILFIQNVIASTIDSTWYGPMDSLCQFVNNFPGEGKDGNDQLYDCSTEKPLWRTEIFTDQSSCVQYDGCHLDDTVKVGEVCLGEKCMWVNNRCYCSKIVDPFSPTNGCDACKFETPSPTFYGECSCTDATGVSVLGIEDSNGVCQCDVNFLVGDNCDGGVGFGLFDSGKVAFVKDSCHKDPYFDLWRQISCIDHHTLSVEWFADDGCSQSQDGLDVQNDTCYYSCGQLISQKPTLSPTKQPTTPSPTKQPTPNPTMTDSPTLSPIVISNKICDLEFLVTELTDFFYKIGDQQWINDCLTLYQTRTFQISIVCGCIGKFSQSMANKWLNCILENPYHGLTVWNMCLHNMYSQSCGSACTDWITTGQPTANPTMTDSPTLSPIVINNEDCDLDSIRWELNDFFIDVGDDQWKEDCLDLYETHTTQIAIVCGCIGKFSQSMVNKYFNCVLKKPYHGVIVWDLCLGSIYSQSCGSRCTDWLTLGQPTAKPTMTDVPTVSPIVINNEDCDLDFIRNQLNDFFLEFGDYQWIEDCLYLYETQTTQISIVCGCIGRFSQSMANKWFNCILKDPFHGVNIWTLCLGSIYTQSCGSQCTDWLRRRQIQQEISHRRRRSQCGVGPLADGTFKLLWSVDLCGDKASDSPTSSPIDSPTSEKIELPTNTQTNPTRDPTESPTNTPTNPTRDPTESPTNTPTESPTSNPTKFPTSHPTVSPTKYPTTQSPTYQPTVGCIKYKVWDELTASENCPSSTWGNTDRGYGSMVACDADLQANLEKSAANHLFEKCSSYCIYDYDGLMEGRHFGYIWKKGCWLAVTKYTCFNGHPLKIFQELLVHVKSICQS